MGTCDECGGKTLENLGYEKVCRFCVRKKIMNLPDAELADNLTTEIFSHKEQCELYESIRRILLRTKIIVDVDEIKKELVLRIGELYEEVKKGSTMRRDYLLNKIEAIGKWASAWSAKN